jgi:hypothetical protein
LAAADVTAASTVAALVVILLEMMALEMLDVESDAIVGTAETSGAVSFETAVGEIVLFDVTTVVELDCIAIDEALLDDDDEGDDMSAVTVPVTVLFTVLADDESIFWPSAFSTFPRA